MHFFRGGGGGGQLYSIQQYTNLQFGLAAALRVFTKIMKPIIVLLRRMGIQLIIFLDEILLQNQTKEGLMQDRESLFGYYTTWVVNTLEEISATDQTDNRISGSER